MSLVKVRRAAEITLPTEVRDAMSSVWPSPEQAAKPPDEQEAEILAGVDEARREYGDERRGP